MAELSKLRLRCRRGTKELDIVLNKYLDEHFETSNDADEDTLNTAFKELLGLEDPLLYAMLLGNEAPLSPEQGIVLHKLQNLNSR